MDGAPVFRYAGDQALLVEFENEISLEVSGKVKRLMAALTQQELPGLGELVPAYRSLLIHYDPERLSCRDLTAAVRRLLQTASALPDDPASCLVTEIPVCYEGEYAADLQEIAAIEQKTPEEIVRIHSQSDYYVYMLGFAPGHPYGARMENPFSFKRRPTPRVKIPAGSIVVQLGLSDIIPFDQPCGWNIIGSTPLTICDYKKEDPFLVHAGEWVRYKPITKEEYERIRKADEAGTYQVKVIREN